jgi:3-hydroxyacyl-[acyl-carrier-protein] dehydratase
MQLAQVDPDTAATTQDRPADRTLGFTELRQWLRHQHPMIYIDRITDHEPGVFLRSVLSVSGNLDPIAGHFPERGIYPGSHLMQAFAQSGIILYQMSTSKLADDEITLIGSVKSRFTKLVVPGDRVIFEVRNDRISGDVFFFSSTATVEGATVAVFKGTLIRTKVEALGRQLW